MSEQLVLQPTLTDLTSEELYEYIERARARRIVGAMEYIAGVKAKNTIVIDKISRRLKSHYEMLGKELDACERAINKVEARTRLIDELKTQAGVIMDYENDV